MRVTNFPKEVGSVYPHNFSSPDKWWGGRELVLYKGVEGSPEMLPDSLGQTI